MTWRDKFRPIIARTLAAGGGDKELLAEWRKLELDGASWPYQVWRDEIARQCGRRKKPKRKVRTMSKEEAHRWMEERQIRMFN